MTHVKISQLCKSYGGFNALTDIDIEIESGEFVVLVGPSGCGKSTLLRTIAGLEDISSGTISFDGKSINDVPAKNRGIAMVFQNYALYPHLSVRANMEFSLKLRKIPKNERKKRVEAAAASLGLSSLLDRLPRQLSGGQRQRVAMGRAIVREPAVFLFDEPLSNLDAKLRVEMRTEIKQMHRRVKATMIYVTHDQVEAMTMGDKIVVMSNGHVEQFGPPIDLYDAPANEFVAEFLGSPAMNFLDGILGESANTLTLNDGTVFALPYAVDAQSGLPVRVGIRPEDLQPAETGLPFIVDVIEPTGSETQLMLSHETLLKVKNLCVLLRQRYALVPGQTLHIAPKPDAHIHLFDKATGKRIPPINN